MARRPILVVEDDAAIREGVVDALTFQGYRPHSAGTYREGLDAALRLTYDLLLLDLVLPGGDGLNLLAELRLARPTVPVILVTARGREEDRVKGLELGADDYVVKPFSVKELLARVAAVLRRSRVTRPTNDTAAADKAPLRFSDVVIDLAARTVIRGGEPVKLTHLEFELLSFFCQNRNRVFSREELLRRVWSMTLAHAGQARTVDNFVAQLRAKLEDDPDHPKHLLTVRGSGYRFVP